MPAAAAGAATGVEAQQEAAAAADMQADSSCGSSSSTTSVSSALLWSSLEAALQAAFPAKLQQQHKELAGWLAAVCGTRPADSTAHESSSSSSSSGPFLTTAVLEAVVEALREELHTRFACSTTTLPVSPVTSPAAAYGDTGVQVDGGSITTSAAAVEAGSFRVNRTAVRQLTEGLLKQHLDLTLQHSQQVTQHVQQLLQEALPSAVQASAAAQQPSAAAQVPISPGEHPVWLQIAEYLCSQGLQLQGSYNSSRSTSTSSKAMSSTRGDVAGCAEAEGATCSTEDHLITAGQADASLLQLLAAVRRAIAVQGVEAAGASGSAAAAARAVGMLRRHCLLLLPADAPTP